MTNYALSIRDHNAKAHIDIEDDIAKVKNGLFTFTLRINNGNIVDYSNTEYVRVNEKYAVIKTFVIEEITIERIVSPDS